MTPPDLKPPKQKRATITVPAPKFRYGDKVEVLNYRRKSATVWERGVVNQIEIGEYFGPGLSEWSYTVVLDRRTLADPHASRGPSAPLRCTVGDKHIRAIQFERYDDA